METFKRSFEAPLSEERGELSGRAFAFDNEAFCEGMKEKIPRGCKVKVDPNAMLLLNHKKDKLLGRNGQNLSFEVKDDGLWFRCKKSATALYDETLKLVKEKILFGCSPSFRAVPKYRGGVRTFDEITITECSLTGFPAYEGAFVTAREKNDKKPIYPPELY